MTTLRRVSRPRGELTTEQARRIDRARTKADQSEAAYRATVLAAMDEGASFSQVSAHTGVSTSTLQKWKKEAS